MQRKPIVTNDGSSSLFVPELNETYHSIHGAIAEAQHVFIQKGLLAKRDCNPLNILEVGFGTGLNTLITAQKSKEIALNINYFGIEKYPIAIHELEAINYGKELGDQALFEQLHHCEWEKANSITPTFKLTKSKLDLTKDALPKDIDLVYFDAFAPNKQASMWEVEVFKKIHTSMTPGGILVTYCCQGQAKRNMIAAGLKVEKTDGPPGKREMLRAFKTVEKNSEIAQQTPS